VIVRLPFPDHQAEGERRREREQQQDEGDKGLSCGE